MDKSPDAFRTISEVAELLDTPAHVLRFWESRFPQIKPVKRAGGRRYYRPADVELLTGIRKLLHDDGLTIRGVQKVLREQGVKHVSGLSGEDDDDLDFVPEHAPRSADPIPLFPVAKPPVPAQPVANHQAMVDEVTELGAEAEVRRVEPAPVPEPEPEPMDEAAARAASLPDHDLPTKPQPQPPLGVSAKPANALPQDVWANTRLDISDKNNIFVEAKDGPDIPVENETTKTAAPTSGTPSREAVAPPHVTRKMEPNPMPDATPAVTLTGDAAPVSKTALPVLDTSEIHPEWLPADLRALHAGAFGAKQAQAEALAQRLEALRNRVGDLGRVPRR
jgi:DNA-binding transcriptional MerR regulator